MLALKHRQNKSQRQRIVVFLCSSLASSAEHLKGDSEKELLRLAKKCKKNNVSVDFVAFGDASQDGESKGVLERFVEAVGAGTGGEQGSYLAVVPPGPGLLSDAIVTTPIVGMGGDMGMGGGDGGFEGINGAGGGPGGSGGAGGGGFEFGIDPSADPELAMALRMSMEEEQNRLERERRTAEEANAAANGRMEGIPEESGAEGQTQENGGEQQQQEEEGGNESKQPTVEDDKTDKDGHGGGDDRMDTA